ncbi:MAG TPA: hypothetical protein VGG19_04505 [Tepidisphaeraceae bacterium]
MLAFSSLVCFILGIIVLPKKKKTLLLFCGSLICFTAALFIYLAYSAGSNLRAGSGLARIFLLFALPILYPILVAVGFAIRTVIELVIHRKLLRRDLLSWGFPTFATLIGIAWLRPFPSSASVYREVVSDQVPKSMSHFQYWWQMLPGDNIFVLKFDVGPVEFSKILAHRTFSEISNKEQISEGLREYFPLDNRPVAPGLDISLPAEPLVTMYHFEQDEPGLAHYENVFTNQQHNVAVITGDNLSRDEVIPPSRQPSPADP